MRNGPAVAASRSGSGVLAQSPRRRSLPPIQTRMVATTAATRPAVSGEIGPLESGIIYCIAISTTARLADYQRDGEWTEAPVLDRARMGRGSRVEGPAIVDLAEATCVVRPGWVGEVDARGTIVLERP